jgi:hypothetical protein
MAKPLSPVKKKPPLKVQALKETEAFSLSQTLQAVRVFRPKNTVTIVSGVDDIDVRDGSLLLLKREAGRTETCMVVFSPGEWISVNVEPV